MRTVSSRVSSYGRHLIDEEDIRAVTDALRSDFLTTGPTVARLERVLCEVTAAEDCVVVSSGTAALHLAAMAADLGPGDVAIVPSMSFSATANAARYVGAEVHFADVDPDTGLIRPADLAAALAEVGSRKAKAVFPVHLAGQCCDMDALGGIAAASGLTIIEDASHALGSVRRRTDGSELPVGACERGGMAVFSMHPVKTVAMGEGGAIAVADKARAGRLRQLRNHGITRTPAEFSEPAEAHDESGAINPWYYELSDLGYNYRASDLQCALGLSQIAKLERFVERRRALRERYVDRLQPLAPLVKPVPAMPWCRAAAWHLMVVLIDFPEIGKTRAGLMRALAKAGVGTQVHYIPIHMQPYYRQRYGKRRLPGAESYYARCLSLPLHAGMLPEDVDAVVGVLADTLDRRLET